MTKFSYDKSLKVGDLVFAYYKGIHRITGLTERNNYNPLVHIEAVLDSKYNPTKKVKNICDIYYCKKIDKRKLIDSLENTHKSQIENLEMYL